ncbi:hypothetical protein FYK55_24535 [Roseiconus nitratireducens]|uniref:SseB protein N-terminal domain-containing protein n=1 Tax=Roseiconus nitratireducens TaxID=2605748 RepID=A0A5M6D2C1_9BACT|nr:SseB family protein [Roseiconus nitratireducens]KAA5539285.1 hypothetical protein FYK55_24535 [Roseiconus nitratireducens]
MSQPQSTLESKLADALEQRDAVLVRQLMAEAEFVLLSLPDEDDDEDAANVLSADIDDMEVLVAFTNEKAAEAFVQSMDEMYDEDDEIEGYVLQGDALLDYMPPDHGLLLNPESDDALIIDLDLITLVQKAEA